MVPPSSRLITTDLPKELHETLGASIQGEVYLRDDPNFSEYCKMFNGNVQTSAKAVTCPVDAGDVSKIISFCAEHGFCPSVKAGGYGTAGWAIGGDIVIDLSRLDDVDIEVPQDGASYTSLRDMLPAGSKGKNKAGQPVVDSSAHNSGKRRREADAQLRVYDAASFAVARFLAGNSLSFDVSNAMRAAPRRRFDDARAHNLHTSAGHAYNNSLASSGTDTSEPPLNPGFGRAFAAFAPAGRVPQQSPSNEDPFGYMGISAGAQPELTSGADPFGYISLHGPASSSPAPSSALLTQPVSGLWNPGLTTVYRNIDLPSAPLNPLPHTEPSHKHAYVTFGAGKRQKEIDTFTAANAIEGRSLSGNAGFVPYHVPLSAHPVGSSIMILGGFGFLGRLHGLSIDNLVEVEMVLSDGRIVIVSENNYPDLWWAIRGAGPAFGVVTRYKARAYPVPVVFAGNLVYCFNRATAPSLIKHFRDCVKGAPRELYANVLLTAGPEGKNSLLVIQMCYIGSKEKGQEHLAAISSWDGEQCLLNEINEKSFLHQQDSVAQVLRGKAGRQWFIRSALITSLPDEQINQTVLQFANAPTGCTWLFELAGGAIADFEDSCVPRSQREATFTIAALHQWEIGTDDPRCVESAEEWISGTMKPVTTGAPFPSFLGRREPAKRTISCFGDNWRRLCEIKRKYDPNCLFKSTFWPLDAAGEPMDPQSHEPASPM